MTPEERAMKTTNAWSAASGHGEPRPSDWKRLDDMIAAAIREAVKAEREACAKVAETLKPLSVTAPNIQRRHGDKIAAAIRERPL